MLFRVPISWATTVEEILFQNGTRSADVTGSWNGCSMSGDDVIERAQDVLRGALREILDPATGECLLCFVARQILEFGCDGTHRFTVRFRDRRAPRATALLERMSRMGACCCDCEIFLNAYTLAEEFIAPGYWHIDERGVEVYEEARLPEPFPACGRVRGGSTQPCGLWERRMRGRF